MTDITTPIFVKITEYKDILDVVDVMKKKLVEVHEGLDTIKKLSAEEDAELRDWEQNIAEIEKRIAFINKAFFEND